MIDYEHYFQKSQNASLCKRLYEESLLYFKERKFTLEEYQKESLLNHLCEMIQRSIDQCPIVIEDLSVFSELTESSLAQSKNLVNQLEDMPDDEMYLLAIHFEIIHYQE